MESADLARTLIAELADLAPFRAVTLERAGRNAYRYAPYRTPPRGGGAIGRFDVFLASLRTPKAAAPSREGRWLRLLHPDGWVREATLDLIDEPPPAPVFLAELLLCTDDHVPQVRQAACRLLARLEPWIETAIILANVPFLVVERRWVAGAEGRRAIDALMARDGVPAAIADVLRTGTESWLPRFFRHLLATDIIDPWLPSLARDARVPAVRARALFVLMVGRVDRSTAVGASGSRAMAGADRAVAVSYDIRELIVAGARDRSVKVRKAAMEGFVRHRTTLENVPGLLSLFVDERNTTIRERLDFIRRRIAAG